MAHSINVYMIVYGADILTVYLDIGSSTSFSTNYQDQC